MREGRVHSPLLFITLFVLTIHALLLAWLAWYSPGPPPQLAEPKSRLYVKTVQLAAERESILAMVSELPEKRAVVNVSQQAEVESPQKEEAAAPEPVLKKEEPKPKKPPKVEETKPKENKAPAAKPAEKAVKPKAEPSKPKELPKKEKPLNPKKKDEGVKEKSNPSASIAAKQPKEEKTTVAREQKPESGERKKLLQKVQESIAKIEERSDKVVSSFAKNRSVGAASPGKVEKSSVQAKGVIEDRLEGAENDYRDELAACMKLLVRLPEYGNVELKLTLGSSGDVKEVEILNAESERNRGHVKSVLPTLTFPPFGKRFDGLGKYTFHITLTNE